MQWKSLAGRCQLPDDRHPLAKIDTRGKALSVTPAQSVTAGASSTFWTSDPIPVTHGQLDRVLSPPDVVESSTDDASITGVFCKTSGQIHRHVLFGLKMIGRVPAQKSFGHGSRSFVIPMAQRLSKVTTLAAGYAAKAACRRRAFTSAGTWAFFFSAPPYPKRVWMSPPTPGAIHLPSRFSSSIANAMYSKRSEIDGSKSWRSD